MNWPIPLTPWIAIALQSLGMREIPGKQNNPTIINWLIGLKAWWREDETPWCATFVSHCLQACGLPLPKNPFGALSFREYGVSCSLSIIPFGAICVKERKGGGHVFFAVAQSADRTIVYGLGGNQGNCVCIVPFKRSDIVAARWPNSGAPRMQLPTARNSADIGASAPGGEA